MNFKLFFNLLYCKLTKIWKTLWLRTKPNFITVVLAFLFRYRPISVAAPMGRRYLNVTHRSKKKDAVLKRPRVKRP